MPIAGVSYSTHNKKIFKQLHLFIEKEADEIARKRSQNMRDALRYRRNLAGESPARYPRSDRKNGRPNEAHSFAAWTIHKKGIAHYTVFNTHYNTVDDFPYPRVIAYGTDDPNSVWVKSVNAGTSKKLVRTGGKVFTSSLPQGLTPYFRRQKAILKTELQQIINDWNKR